MGKWTSILPTLSHAIVIGEQTQPCVIDRSRSYSDLSTRRMRRGDVEKPSARAVYLFQDIFEGRGVMTTVRKP